MKNNTFSLLKTFNKVETIHWWWIGRRYLLTYLLGQNAKGDLLDVGIGTGETLLYLKNTYKLLSLYGIDSSKSSVVYAANRGILMTQNITVERAAFTNQSFDYVLLLDVLEHIQDDGQIIKRIKNWLKKGGKIIIMSPALPFIWTDHDKNQGHYRRYTKEKLHSLANKSNLQITFLTHFNFLLSPIIIIIRLLGKIPFLKFIVAYDNGINYGVMKYPMINRILARIFTFELMLLKYNIRYPWGISICAVFEKKEQ